MRRKLFMFNRGGDDRFIITVKSDNLGVSSNNQFIIPTTTGTYLYNVQTSDGYMATGLTGSHTITFPSGAGTYDVFISGDFPRIYFNNGGDKLKILTINNWGNYGSTNPTFNQSRAFMGCTNLTSIADDVIYINQTVNGDFMFNGTSLTSLPSSMTFSSLTNGSNMFRENSLASLPSGMTLNNLTNGVSMFHDNSLTSLPSSMTLNSLTNGAFMFFRNSLTSLPSSMTLNSLTSGAYMFAVNSTLSTVGSNLFFNTSCTNLSDSFTVTGLSQLSIDTILVNIESNGTNNGTFKQTGGSAPSVTGEAAIDAMRLRGWTITVTGGY